MFFLKRLSLAFCILFGASLLFISCDDEGAAEKPTGEISFSFAASSASGGRLKSGDAKSILVTVKDQNGTVVYNRLKLDLFKLNNEFLSQPLVLDVGAYQLTEFIVLNDDEEVIHLAPIENSELAYLVSEALPVNISIVKDQVTKVEAEVIEAEGHTGLEFGYATFTFHIVNTLNFLSAAFAYDAPNHTLDLTAHHLEVKSGSDILFDGPLQDITSSTRVKSNYENYTLTFTKNGYTSVVKSFTKAQLLEFKTTTLTIVFTNSGLAQGLEAHYTFSGGQAEDLSGNDNDGVITGAVAGADANGNANEAMLFNSIDDKIVVDAPSFIDNNEGTFAAWVKFNNFGQVQYVGSVADENSIESYLSLLRVDTDRKIGVYQREVSAANWVTGTTQINANQYYHLVLVSTGSAWKIFINGHEETLQIVNGSNNGKWISDLPGIDNFAIGTLVMQQPYTVPFLDGNVDEVRLYSRPLSLTEIEELYLASH